MATVGVLDWADNTEPDLAGYNVYRSITTGSGFAKINGALVTTSAYNDTLPDPATTYYYKVTAVDTTGNESAFSAEVSIASGLTVVGASRATTWNVTAQVGSQRAASWNISTAVGSERAASWDVGASGVVGSSRAASWDILQGVGSERDTTWNVSTAVGSQRAASWNVSTTVGSERAASWDVASDLAAVGSQRSTTWNVTTAVGSQRTTTWDVAWIAAAPNLTTTTAPVLAAADDQYAAGNGEAWPPPYRNHIDGNSFISMLKARYGSFSYGYEYYLRSGLLSFDTSAVPDNEVVSSVTLRFHVLGRANANNRQLCIDSANWNGTSADFARSNNPPNDVLNGKSLSAFAVGEVNDVPLDVTNFVSKTGVTKIRLHITGGQPTGSNNLEIASYESSQLSPELVITSYVPIVYPASGRGTGSGGIAQARSGAVVMTAPGQGVGSGGKATAYRVPKEAPLPVYGPTRLGLTLSGASGALRMRSRLYLSDVYATKIKELPRVDGASIGLSNYRANTWELSPQMRSWAGYDPLSDFILATTELWMDGSWQEFPRGLYTFLGYSRTHSLTHSEYSALPGESLESILAADGPDQGYEVLAGTGALAAVTTILLGRGIPQTKIRYATQGDVILPATLYFDTAVDADSITWLGICNSILNSAGFYALWTDAWGNFTTCDCGDLEHREPDLYYVANAFGSQAPDGPYDPVVVAEISENFEDENFANKVVATTSEIDDELPMVSIAVNRDPNSPGSVQNLGRRLGEGKERYIKKDVTVRAATTQAELDSVARAWLTRYTSLYHTMSVQTIADPRCGPRQTYQLHINRGDELISADKWRVINFQQELGDAPGPMTHNLARRESLTNVDGS